MKEGVNAVGEGDTEARLAGGGGKENLGMGGAFPIVPRRDNRSTWTYTRCRT